NHAPVVSAVAADSALLRSEPSACPPTTATVTVQASDGTGVADVVLHWRLTQQLAGIPHIVASGEAGMTASGSTYAATVGHFSKTGTLDLWATATDGGGLSTDSSVSELAVAMGCIA